MTTEAICRTTTSGSRADTRPGPFVHPHSPQRLCRAAYHAGVARRSIVAARAHRLAGRACLAACALMAARLARLNAAYELNTARRGG